MPAGNDQPFTEWNRIYQHDVEELERCCADPDAAGCLIDPIESLQRWIDRQPSQ
jgi:hypothetical protein